MYIMAQSKDMMVHSEHGTVIRVEGDEVTLCNSYDDYQGALLYKGEKAEEAFQNLASKLQVVRME